MISKGYKAPCCIAIVKEIGGNTALIFSPTGKYAQDSGVDIAKRLGYQNIIEKDEDAYKSRTDMPEIKYLCSGIWAVEFRFLFLKRNMKKISFSREKEAIPYMTAIANSDQMSEWKMNNTYDRSIPRCIVESAGVPREWFGVRKRGAGFSYHFDWMKRIVSRMSSKSGMTFLHTSGNIESHLSFRRLGFYKKYIRFI